MALPLTQIVADFATGFLRADAARPQSKYGSGLAPRSEIDVVARVLAEMRSVAPQRYASSGQELAFPGSDERADLWIGDPLDWVIEVKMARAYHGKVGAGLDATALKDVISPWDCDRSAVTDAAKLATSAFWCRRAVLIYGFDYDGAPLGELIDCFELVAQRRAVLSGRAVAPLPSLVHPVHSRGAVYAWEVKARLGSVS
jgi:hypothetical protein